MGAPSSFSSLGGIRRRPRGGVPFLESPAQASAAAAFLRAIVPELGPAGPACRGWRGFSGTQDWAAWQGGPAKEALILPVARSPRALPSAPLGRGGGRRHAGVQTPPWGLALETRVHSRLGPFLPYIFLLIITAGLIAKFCVPHWDYIVSAFIHSFSHSLIPHTVMEPGRPPALFQVLCWDKPGNEGSKDLCLLELVF